MNTNTLERKKILHISAIAGNISKFRLKLLNELRSKGLEIHVVASPGDRRYVDEIEKSGHKFISIPIRELRNPIVLIATVYKLYKLINKEGYEIIHTHTPSAGFIGRLASLIAGHNKVFHTTGGLYFTENSTKLFHFFFSTLEKIYARFTDVIFSVNKEDIATMQKLRIKPRYKIVYSGPGGVDPNLYQKKRSLELRSKIREEMESGDRFLIGFIGRFTYEKGTKEFMECIKFLTNQHPNQYQFIIAGWGKQENELKEFIRNNNLESTVKFLGLRDDVNEIMYGLDLLTSFSYREGLPVVVLEAMMSGKPVIGFNIRGCREAIKNGETGFIIPFKDVKSYIKAIRKISENPSLAKKMGEAGRKRAENEYLQFHHVQRQMIIYDEYLCDIKGTKRELQN